MISWQTRNDSIWLNHQLYSYSYDSKNNNINTVIQEWNDSLWVNWIQFQNTYDTNNNLTAWDVAKLEQQQQYLEKFQ